MFKFDEFVRVVKIFVVVVLMLVFKVNGKVFFRVIILILIRGVSVDVKMELDWINIVSLVLIKIVK